MADGTIKILTDLSTEGFQKGISKLGGIAKTGLSAFGSAVTVAGTVLAGLGTAAAKVGSNVETSLAKASTLFGDVAVDTEGLEKKVLALSSATGIAADVIGSTLYDALSSGIPVSEDMGEAMGYMSKSADLARAGFTDINTAATSTAKVLNAYKMDVSETDRVHKILMATQNKGITTVGELGAVLAQVTPTAAAMNVSFEQVGAALATMTAQGTPTAQATTQLNSLFAELGKQGTVAQKALMKATEGTKYAGKGFSDLMAEGVPLNEVLDLMGVTADMSDQSLLDMFGSIEAGKAALSMAGQNSAQYSTNLKEMSTSADLVGDAVAKMDDTLQVRSQKMMESLKNLGVVVFDSLESPLKEAVTVGTEYLAELNEAFSTGLDSGVEALGGVFADIAVRAAEEAPKMLDAGANLLLSFLNGLEQNSGKIATAAAALGKALVSSLAKLAPQVGKIGLKIITAFSKELFGSKIGSEVEKLGKTIESGFRKIGAAVSKALDKIAPAVKKASTAALNLANGALTVLGDSIAFVVEHCDFLIPALAAVAGAFAAQAVISKVTSMMDAHAKIVSTLTALEAKNALQLLASNGALTAKEILVGLLTGKITLATVAQGAWNSVMAANPIGLVITAVAALGAGLAALSLLQEDEITLQERLDKSTESLSGKYTEALGKIGEYKDGIQTATGVLDTLNAATGLTSEKQQELAAEMDSVQQQINAICSTASAERRQLTDDEIASLEELIQKQTEIAQRETELYTLRGKSVQTYASQIASSAQYTAEEFEAEAQSVTKSAQDSYDQRVTYAKEHMIQQLAELEQTAAVNSEVRALYEDKKNEIIKGYQEETAAAQEQMDTTNTILADGFAMRATEAQAWVETSAQYNTAELELKKQYNADVEQAWAEYNAMTDKNTTEAKNALLAAQTDEFNITSKARAELTQLRENKARDFQNISADEISTLVDMVSLSEGQYDKLNAGTKTMVDQFLLDIATLPEPAREDMNKTLAGMNLEIDSGGKLIRTNGEKAGEELIAGWASKNRDVIESVKGTITLMDTKSGEAEIKAPKMLPISNAEEEGYSARRTLNKIFSTPIYQSVHVTTYRNTVDVGKNASGGVTGYAKGGVTRYARGGVSAAAPKISRHAAGVFTKRTRLWDPVTGINEYGEAGHEALLPLKESVFNELAKGIVRQLSPAKLAGLMAQIQSTVRASMADISVQLTAKAALAAPTGTPAAQSTLPERLFEKLDDIAARLERLSGLTVSMNGEAVGRLVTPEVNVRMQDLYDLDERGQF